MDLMLIIFFIAALMITSGAIYNKLQTKSVTEPFLALFLGILVGPDVLNIIKSSSPEEEFKILKIACEFTIAVALMATTLRFPPNIFKKHPVTLTNLVFFGMIFMALLSAGVFYLILPEFSFFQCLLLGAIITPTDPVVASTLISGKNARKYLPDFIKNSLSFEAGINDGLAYPLIFLALFLAGSATFDLQEWTTRILLYENILCAGLAYIVGSGAGILMKKAHKAGWMSPETVLPFSLAVTLFLLSGFNLLKMNGILAVFAGGFAFAKDITAKEDIKEGDIQNSMERMTTVPVFFILGLMLPWQEWFVLGWKAVAIVILILLFRRIPALIILMPVLPEFKKKIYSILLMGWFGPIGVATLYYSIHINEKASFSELWAIPSLIVVASTVVHGLTSIPLQKLYHHHSSKANEFPK